MENIAEQEGGRFTVLNVDYAGDAEADIFRYDGVYSLNGHLYELRRSQYRENVDYLLDGYESHTIIESDTAAFVGAGDYHLSADANIRVFEELVRQMNNLSAR